MNLQQLKGTQSFQLGHCVKGVPFFNRRNTKGVPFLSTLVDRRVRGLTLGGTSPPKTFFSNPRPGKGTATFIHWIARDLKHNE